MKLFFQKMLRFLAAIITVGVILGSVIWVIGTTYFWDTSRLTLTIAASETPSTATADLSARLVYTDFLVLGIPYSIHFTLPSHHEVICTETCIFPSLPRGEGRFTVRDASGIVSRGDIHIDPDTDGSIDLRPKIASKEITDEKILVTIDLPGRTDASLPPGRIVAQNRLQWISIVGIPQGWGLYDITTKQVLPLSQLEDITALGRTDNANVYYLYSESIGMLRYDRYGREPTSTVPKIVLHDREFTWGNGTTLVTYGENILELAGIWFPIFGTTETYATNGEQVQAIQ